MPRNVGRQASVHALVETDRPRRTTTHGYRVAVRWEAGGRPPAKRREHLQRHDDDPNSVTSCRPTRRRLRCWRIATSTPPRGAGAVIGGELAGRTVSRSVARRPLAAFWTRRCRSARCTGRAHGPCDGHGRPTASDGAVDGGAGHLVTTSVSPERQAASASRSPGRSGVGAGQPVIDVDAAGFDAELFEPSRCAGSGPVFGGYPGVADRQSGHRALLKLAELTADRVSLGSGEARYEFCSTILRGRCRPQRCGTASTQRTPARHHPRTRRRSGRRRPCPLPTARSQPGGEPARTRRAGPSARTRRNPRHGDAGQVSATATRREMR